MSCCLLSKMDYCFASRVMAAYQLVRIVCRILEIHNIDELRVQLDLLGVPNANHHIAECRDILAGLRSKEVKALERKCKYLGL